MSRAPSVKVGVAVTVLAIVLIGRADAFAQPQSDGFHKAVAPSPAAGTVYLHPQRVPAGDGELAGVERGVMFVPVNRSDPASAVIGVEFYRFKSDEAPSGTPPVFQLRGGPGFPGLAGSLENSEFLDRIRIFTDRADFIVVGQRGIGSSTPNTICEPSGFGDVDAMRRASAKCRDYWKGTGLDLRGFSAVEAAADVADIARALGYEKIFVWGGSFGSHWGMTVLRFHPEIVQRAILNAMEGPDHTYDSPTGVLNSLKRMAATADQAPELEGLIPEGGLIAALEAVITRAEQEPITATLRDSETVVFDADDVRALALGYTRRASSRSGMRSWPGDIIRLYRGDFGPAAQIRRQREQSGGGTRTASYFMLDCGSGITPDRLAKLQSDPAANVVGDLTWWYETSCPPWNADLGDEFRADFTTDIPTVIVHGTWDTSTPLENALELAPMFTNSKLVLVKGGSHGALGEALEHDPSFGDALWKFLLTGDMSDVPDEIELPPIKWTVPPSLRR